MLWKIEYQKIKMSEHTTSNGFEIKNPTEKLQADGFRELMGEKYGLDGLSAELRVHQLKQLPVETIHAFIDDINKSLQGSRDSLEKTDTAMKIGTASTIHPEHRTAVLEGIIGVVKASPDTIHPARIADVLAMTVVMLHPFEDGNGRTSRAIGLAFRDEYDTEEFYEDFDVLTEPRDDARKRGGFIINGYIPRLPEGFNQSDPIQVGDYLAGLLTQDTDMPDYIGPYPPTPLYK